MINDWILAGTTWKSDGTVLVTDKKKGTQNVRIVKLFSVGISISWFQMLGVSGCLPPSFLSTLNIFKVSILYGQSLTVAYFRCLPCHSSDQTEWSVFCPTFARRTDLLFVIFRSSYVSLLSYNYAVGRVRLFCSPFEFSVRSNCFT